MYTLTEERILERHQWQGFLKSSMLLILAFATVFFPRLLETLGAPSPVNFVHFAIVPAACGLVLLKMKTKQRNQLITVQLLLIALGGLLCAELASAVINSAGIINVTLSYLLLAEPFMILVAVVSLPASHRSIQQFRTWFIWFHLFHIGLALFQRFILRYHLLEDLSDNIQGVFYHSGSGHVVGASVSVAFGIYYLLTAKERPLWQRGLIMFASLVQLVTADAKQVIVVILVGFALLALVKVANIKKLVLYTVLAILLFWFSYWAIYTFEFLHAFRTWIQPELYGPNGDATQLKIKGVEIILSHYESVLNGLFGLGPGHTIGRLGGWMLGDYSNLLDPLGSTKTTIGRETWGAVGESWLGDRSSFFSPFWGFAGIWGDLGFVGLGAYLLLWWIVWKRICKDDFSRFLVFTVLLNGLIFTQLEEPAYMLASTILIGLRWQEKRTEALAKHTAKIPYRRHFQRLST